MLRSFKLPVLFSILLTVGVAHACYYSALNLENPADYYFRYCYAGCVGIATSESNYGQCCTPLAAGATAPAVCETLSSSCNDAGTTCQWASAPTSNFPDTYSYAPTSPGQPAPTGAASDTPSTESGSDAATVWVTSKTTTPCQRGAGASGVPSSSLDQSSADNTMSGGIIVGTIPNCGSSGCPYQGAGRPKDWNGAERRAEPTALIGGVPIDQPHGPKARDVPRTSLPTGHIKPETRYEQNEPTAVIKGFPLEGHHAAQRRNGALLHRHWHPRIALPPNQVDGKAASGWSDLNRRAKRPTDWPGFDKREAMPTVTSTAWMTTDDCLQAGPSASPPGDGQSTPEDSKSPSSPDMDDCDDEENLPPPASPKQPAPLAPGSQVPYVATVPSDASTPSDQHQGAGRPADWIGGDHRRRVWGRDGL